MPLLLLLAFIGVPLLEIAVFIQVGGLIGLWPTLGLVILTAVIGTWQLRAQGLATLASGRAQMDAGQLPTRELFDGLCLLFAGALLLTPGFVTDAVGMLLFVPAVRDAIRGWFRRHVAARGETRVWVDGREVHRGARRGPRSGPGQATHPGRDAVIDVDYQEIDGEPDQRAGPDDSNAKDAGEGPRP